jgi:hypothetical protein
VVEVAAAAMPESLAAAACSEWLPGSINIAEKPVESKRKLD